MSEFSHLKFGMLLVRKTPNASNALMVLFGNKQDDGIAIRTNLENFGNKLGCGFVTSHPNETRMEAMVDVFRVANDTMHAGWQNRLAVWMRLD